MALRSASNGAAATPLRACRRDAPTSSANSTHPALLGKLLRCQSINLSSCAFNRAFIGVILSLAFVGQAWGAVEIAEFDLPEGGGGPITAGPEGALWFAPGGRLGRVGSDGKVDEFTLSGQTGYPQDITAGPDGNLWISTSQAIDRVTTAGALTEFSLPGKNELPGKIVAGPDGNLWFTLWTPPTR